MGRLEQQDDGSLWHEANKGKEKGKQRDTGGGPSKLTYVI